MLNGEDSRTDGSMSEVKPWLQLSLMSTFEPVIVLSIVKNSSAVPLKDKKNFELKWKEAVS